jgi:hypothetical protein
MSSAVLVLGTPNTNPVIPPTKNAAPDVSQSNENTRVASVSVGCEKYAKRNSKIQPMPTAARRPMRSGRSTLLSASVVAGAALVKSM